jgi:hypothetical protein
VSDDTLMDDTLMWEVRAAPGRLPDLLRWVGEHALPDLDADVYTSSDDRLVLIVRGLPKIPAPPDDLVARSPHAWPFKRVSR